MRRKPTRTRRTKPTASRRTKPGASNVKVDKTCGPDARVTVPKPALLTVTATAKLLGITRSSLDRARSHGSGPDFIREGRRVFYRQQAVDAYLQPARQAGAFLETVPEGDALIHDLRPRTGGPRFFQRHDYTLH